jgi:hypothetical protein
MSSCEECCEVTGWPEGHYTLDSGKSIRVSCPCDCHSETKEEGDMAQHTLGPWITGTQGGDGRVVYVGADMMFVPGSGPTTKANARLISAAPDLLAVAKLVQRYFDVDYEESYQDSYEILKGVEQAIYKAIGKED